MRKNLICLVLAFCLFPLWHCSAVAGEYSDRDRDKLIESLTERVERLEEVIGEEAQPVLIRSTIGERLDRIEREFHESQSKLKPQEYNLQHDIRQLNES